LHYRPDERFAWEGLEIDDQRMGSHQFVEVDVHRHGQGGRAGSHIQGLTGAHPAPIAGLRVESDAGRAFQGSQLALPLRRSLKDHRGSCDRDRDGTAPDGTAAGILRDPEQNRAAVDIRGASTLVESKNRIGTETGNGEIRKGELGA
jgi:hypothetical protein